jgi:hypothetical protein
MITLGVGVGVGVEVGVLVGVGVDVAVPVGTGVCVTVGVTVAVTARRVGKDLVAVGREAGVGEAASLCPIWLRTIARTAPPMIATATTATTMNNGIIHLFVFSVTGSSSFVVA